MIFRLDTWLCYYTLFLGDPRQKIGSKKHTIAIGRSSIIWAVCLISIRETYKIQLFVGFEVKAMGDGPFQVMIEALFYKHAGEH